MVRIDKEAVEGIPVRRGPCYVGHRPKSGLPRLLRFQGQVHSEEHSFVFRTSFGH